MEFDIAMKKLLLALALWLLPSLCWAQCTGVFPNNTICGNNSGSPSPPSIIPFSSVTGPSSSTSGDIVTYGGTSGSQLIDQQTISTSQTVAVSAVITSSFTYKGVVITQFGTVNTSTGIVSGDIPYFATPQTLGDTGITSASIATLTTSNQVVNGGGATVSPFIDGTITSGSVFTGNCGAGPLHTATNSGPFTWQKPTKDGACDWLLTNGGGAGNVTLSGFTVINSGTIGTANTSQFIIHIEEIGGVATFVSTNIK